MSRIRTASKFAVLLGVCLFIASAPICTATGIIGSVALIAFGTVGVIETEARHV